MKICFKLVVLGFLTLVCNLPPTANAEVGTSVNGSARFRFEDTQWYGSAASASSFTRTSFFSLRIRPSVTFQIDEATSLVLSPQFAKVFGRDYSYTQFDSSGVSAYNENFHMHEAFGKAKLSDSSSVKVGRMIVSYGDQLILSAGEWTTFGRTFDGAVLSFKNDLYELDALGLKIESSANAVGTDRDLAGLYSKWSIVPELKVFEVYGLYESNQVGGLNDSRSLIGTRLGVDFDKLLDFGFEFAVQKGTGAYIADNEAHSIIVASAGYAFADFAKLRIGYEFNQADDFWRDWYPLTKSPLGRNEIVGRRNLTSHAVKVSFEPVESFKVRLDFWKYQRGSALAPAYRPTDSIAVGSIANSSSIDIGQAIDFAVTQRASDKIEYGIGATLFEQGSYLKDQFGDRQLTDFYAVANLNF